MKHSPRSCCAHRRGSWALVGVALVLGAAFVVAPVWLAGGEHGGGFFGSAGLSRAVGDSVVAFWRADDRTLPAGLTDLVQYWMRYHVAKAVLAGLLLVVLAVLATRLWRPSTDSAITTRRRRMAGVAGAAATAGSLGAAVLVMANVQGAVAPLSSLLSLMPSASDDPAVAQVRAQVVHQLRAGGTPRPALARMVDDFGTYHAVVAVSALVIACAAIAVSVAVGRSFVMTGRSEPAIRRTKAVASACFAVVGMGVVVLAAANLGNAISPAHALLLFYAG